MNSNGIPAADPVAGANPTAGVASRCHPGDAAGAAHALRTCDDPTLGQAFTRLFDSAQEAMLIVNPAGRVLLANPAASRLFGADPGELLAHGVEALLPEPLRAVHAEHRAGFGASVRARAAAGGPAFRARRFDGTEFQAEISLNPLEGECVLVGVHDVTQRLLADRALRDSEMRYRLLVENAADGIFVIRPDGRCADVNPAGAAMLGRTADEVRSLPLSEVVAPEDQARIQPELTLIAEGSRSRAEWRFRHSDGSTLPGELVARRLPDGNVLAVVRDLSERKRSEATVRRLRRDMEELLQLHVASQTAQAIAHDLNQPLIAVTSYAEAGVRMLRAGNPHPDRLLQALEGSAAQAQRAARVVRELLETLHKGTPPPDVVDLSEAVRNALAVVSSNGREGFEARLDLDANLPPVQGNQVQIEKVLSNLIVNGMDAMESAIVPQKILRIAIRVTGEPRMAQVTVSDNGPGIDERTAVQLFEPFFTTKVQGIGMGLPISRALVEAQGGQLWFDASAKPGATFHFTLPLAP